MTIVKPSVEAKTLQAKLGFQDRQLSTPVHDEMMVWLDGHIEKIAQDILTQRGPMKVRPCGEMVNDYLAILKANTYTPYRERQQQAWTASKLVEPLAYATPTLKVHEKIWEYPIATGRGNQYVTGFVDFVADVRVTRMDLEYRDSLDRWVIGSTSDRYRLFFEVKPDIPSTGEFLRQVRFYQNYETDNDILWLVLSPDTRARSVIVSQKIIFVEYPTNA